MVIVGKKALRARSAKLRESAESVEKSGDDPATVYLLLFYAAECGLKERLLTRRGQWDSSCLDPTHDLRALAKDLGLPRVLAKNLRRSQTCRLQQPAGATIALKELHQAWRYGAKLQPDDEGRADEMLRALIAWCEQD